MAHSGALLAQGESAAFVTAIAAGADADGLAPLRPVLDREDLEFALLFGAPAALQSVVASGVPAGARSRVFGCTTSGELTPAGYVADSAVCIGFGARHFRAVSRLIRDLRSFSLQSARDLVLSALWELRSRVPRADARNTFALLLVDSITQAEELVAAALGSELGNIQLVGGSAGDNWSLERTPLLVGGNLHDDSALLLLVHTDLDFRHYNFHHYRPSAVRGVITAATPAKRLVHQIDGEPAIRGYARLCGLAPDAVDVDQLSVRPLILMIGDKGYARGITQICDDGSLRFACAIDEGLVFRVAEPGDFVRDLEQRFAAMRAELGPPALTLAFECAARRLVALREGLQPQVAELFGANRVWGFSCMGEQSNAVNMNNSFNCIAFSGRATGTR